MRDTEYLAERDPADPFGLTYAQRMRSDFDDNFARMMIGGSGVGSPRGLISAPVYLASRTIDGEVVESA